MMALAAPLDTRPVTILLVDDDDGDAKAVTRAFRSACISNPILRAIDGQAALDMLRGRTDEVTGTPLLLLVDVNMPRMNGHDFVAEIRKDTDLRKLVVFMLTTSGARADIDAAYDNNVAGYIVKETAGRDFLQMVGTLENYWNLIEMPKTF
jgi:CheY-like chemotaxis protein